MKKKEKEFSIFLLTCHQTEVENNIKTGKLLLSQNPKTLILQKFDLVIASDASNHTDTITKEPNAMLKQYF